MINYTNKMPNPNAPYDVMCLSLNIDMTIDEMKDCIQKAMAVINNGKRGFCFSIDGWDDDPREIWEIPEVLNFMKQIVSLGFMTILEVSTSLKEMLPKEYQNIGLPGFGALELWLCVNRKMKYELDISPQLMSNFFEDLESSNQRCAALCREPSYGKNTVFDGPTQHKGFQKHE